MKTTTITALAITGAAVLTPTAAYAHTGHTPACATVHDHITKTDNGHGVPAEWADLSLARATTVCKTATGYTIKLHDEGNLWTRPGAGSPNGTGAPIAHRVPGKVFGTYWLTASGGTLAHKHGDVSLSSTEYVKSLFSEGTTVVGGRYAWAYETCVRGYGDYRERWLDSSILNDGAGAQAGNITGKTCRPHHPKPTPTPTSPSPSPTQSTPSSSGEAPPATPVTRQPQFTG